jgi:FAD/FMN-containing dehydrogenase
MTGDFLKELGGAFPEGTVLVGDAIGGRYFTDIGGSEGERPLAVVRPSSTDDVSRLLRLCHDARVPVVPQGGMTGLVRGGMPAKNEVVLSMERMAAIEEVDRQAGIVVAQAGTVLQALQERVEQDGFIFPLDLGGRGSCTIGGNISTNAGGNRVIRYGMMRDLVVGLEVVTADGTVLRGLRKYLKNNTGLDLKQLFIGSEGTLGVVTRAALRIFPAPADRPVALVGLASFDKVVTLLTIARRRLSGDLTAFEVMWNIYYRLVVERVRGVAAPLPSNHAFYVLLEASGFDAARVRQDLEGLLEEALETEVVSDGTVADSLAAAQAIWRVRDSSVELGRTFATPRLGLDVSLPIDRMEAYTVSLERAVREIDATAFAVVLGHLGDGNLHVSFHFTEPQAHERIEETAYAITGQFGGSISAEHGIGLLKRPYLKLSRTPEEIETMRTLKRALDPRNILSPGRIIVVGQNEPASQAS